MKILLPFLEFAYGSLDGNETNEVFDAFDEMFDKLKEDECGYVHYNNITELYFEGITNEDKQKLEKEVTINLIKV